MSFVQLTRRSYDDPRVSPDSKPRFRFNLGPNETIVGVFHYWKDEPARRKTVDHHITVWVAYIFRPPTNQSRRFPMPETSQTAKQNVLPVPRPEPKEKARNGLKRGRRKRDAIYTYTVGLANDALSHQAKAGVTPIERPARREKKAKGLTRTEMKRKPSKLRRSPLGHCTEEQKERVANRVCIVCGHHFNQCDPAHVVPRGHPKVSAVDADDVRAVVPLCRNCHDEYDEGLDLLPYLEPAWRDSQEWAAGAVGLASALRSITGGTA